VGGVHVLEHRPLVVVGIPISPVSTWTVQLYLFVLFYAFLTYLLCALLLPRRLHPHESIKDYFCARRARPFMAEMASDNYALDITRARTLLGWTPQHDFLKTLLGMLAKLREDPADWYCKNHMNPRRRPNGECAPISGVSDFLSDSPHAYDPPRMGNIE
jgi:hypothetical protein